MNKSIMRFFLTAIPMVMLSSLGMAQDQAPVSISPVMNIQDITNHGGRVDWSFQNVIAFDRLDANGFYNVYTMKPDGSNVTCLTCDRNALGLPHRNVGSPAWDSSGRYLSLVVEKDLHPPAKNSSETSPGAGVFSDLWVLDLIARKAYMVVEVPVGENYGILHPYFSFDGRRLSWSQQYKAADVLVTAQQFGYYKLKVADFAVGGLGRTYLENIQTYQPDGEAFYENHGFSPDGSKLIFSHNAPGTSPFQDNIYTMNITTGELAQQLTNEDYNEHAFYSPNGRTIVWMTTMGESNKGTDYWLMNANGSNKTRLTYFNQPGNLEYTGKKTIASVSSWSPDGKHIVAYLQLGTAGTADYQERDVVITLQ